MNLNTEYETAAEWINAQLTRWDQENPRRTFDLEAFHLLNTRAQALEAIELKLSA